MNSRPQNGVAEPVPGHRETLEHDSPARGVPVRRSADWLPVAKVPLAALPFKANHVYSECTCGHHVWSKTAHLNPVIATWLFSQARPAPKKGKAAKEEEEEEEEEEAEPAAEQKPAAEEQPAQP